MTAYAVISQGSDGYLDESSAEFFTRPERAVSYLDTLKDDTFRVFSVQPVPESALWDWSFREPGSDKEPSLYVNERAARNSCHRGAVVVKRRLGTANWIVADEEDR